jgi:predicted peptidase
MKYLKPILFLVLFFCANANETFSQTSAFSHEKYINETGDTLNYRMLYPDWNTLRKYPLIIFLHGLGERGNDNESQLKFGIMNLADDKISSMYPAFIIAPQCPQNMHWANIAEDSITHQIHLLTSPSNPIKLLIELIQKVKKDFPVDGNRIYITGLSMGGYGTYDAIERYPNLFAAAVPICGAGDTSKASLIAHIPIWIFHGAEDPTVNPLYSLYMLGALIKAGAHPGFTQYPEVGHFSDKGAYTDTQMIAWLFRQHK